MSAKATINSRLAQAGCLHGQGDIAGAYKLYREILNASPREIDALHMMGIIAQQAGNSELALKFFEDAIAINMDFAKAWYNRGVALSALRRDTGALQINADCG